MSFKTVILEKKEGIAKLILKRPEKLNALNQQMRMEMFQALADARRDSDVRVVIIAGATLSGKPMAFSAGEDMSELGGLVRGVRSRGERETPPFDLWSYIETYEKPLIAMVNGYCVGGGVLLVALCDFAIASENSQFWMPEIDRGIFPTWGVMLRLTRIIGVRKTKELTYTGDRIDTKEAEKIELINKVVLRENLEKETMTLAKNLASKAPIVIRSNKRLIRYAMEMSGRVFLEIDREEFLRSIRTEDFKEAMAAYVEKRTAKFKGK